jgi:phosphoribosylanthranilate isomerase
VSGAVVRVKICGITNWTDARLAVKAGADALGFNFYLKSPRYIAPEAARTIATRLPRRVLLVGVFVNASAEDVLRVVRNVDLNAVQLHGEESPETVQRLSESIPVIKAFRVRRGFAAARLARYGSASAFLLDGFHRTLRGGTGNTFDWSLAKKAKRYGSIIVAGGLNPENVASAIRLAEPFGVDVCSGVESQPGKKDPERLTALMLEIERVRNRVARK